MAKNKYNKPCPVAQMGLSYIDYKNTNILRKFVSRYGKIVPRYYSGTSLKAQKELAQAIKRARFMGLLKYVN